MPSRTRHAPAPACAPPSDSGSREQSTRANAGDPRGDNGTVMTLTQLNAFVLVARLGSVTAAANALSVSEPAVSQALSALRQHLGDQLLTRSPAGMTLTPAAPACSPPPRRSSCSAPRRTPRF